jgi:hypothetical protein
MPPTFKTEYTPLVQSALAQGRVPALGPGSPHESMRSLFEALTIESVFEGWKIREADMASCCLAGLWLHFDFLNECHEISQEVHTPEGSYWHAIMHRREPDHGNSKYWFHRVGKHPVIDELVEMSRTEGFGYTSPFDFVDLCERVRGTGTPQEVLACRVQLMEWMMLFDYCWNKAI